MINLELPKKLKASANQAHQVAAQIFRPISRKYDLAEHEYPVELDEHSAIVDGLSTMVVNGTQLKVYAWYDNEWGYSSRLSDFVEQVAQSVGAAPVGAQA